MHDADQVDVDHPPERVDIIFLAAVDDRALGEDENVEAFGESGRPLDRIRVGYIDLFIIQTRQVRPFVARIIRSRCAGAPDPHHSTLRTEKLRDAVADTAGAAHHERALARKFQNARTRRHSRMSLSVDQEPFVLSGPVMSGRSLR